MSMESLPEALGLSRFKRNLLKTGRDEEMMCTLRVGVLAGVMQSMCQAAGAHITSCSRSSTPQDIAHITQQLCAGLLRLFQAILTTEFTRTAPEEHASAGAASQAPAAQHQPPPVTSHHTLSASRGRDTARAAQQAQQQPEEALVEAPQQTPEPSGSHSALMAVLYFALQACEACTSQQTAELAAILTLYQRASSILREQGQYTPLKAIDMYLGSATINQLG